MSWLFSKAFTDEHMSCLQARIQAETERAANLLDSMSAEEQRIWPSWSEYRSAVEAIQAKIDKGWLSQDVCSKAPLCKWPKGNPCSCDDNGTQHREAASCMGMRPSSQRNKNRQQAGESTSDETLGSLPDAFQRKDQGQKERCWRPVCMSLRCLQALAEEYSEGNSLAGEQYAQLNVMPTPHKFSRNDRMMEFSDLSRFGLTCAVLTESHGEELLTSFLEDFRARTLAQQVEGLELAVKNHGYGSKWQESFMKSGHLSCSWKILQGLEIKDLITSSVTLPKWGMTANGSVYQHHLSELRTKEIEHGLLPTPVADDTGHRKNRYAQGGRPLSYVIGGKLNPEFVEWMMGWPIGWTELKPLAMDKFHEWLQQHSPCSTSLEVAA